MNGNLKKGSSLMNKDHYSDGFDRFIRNYKNDKDKGAEFLNNYHMKLDERNRKTILEDIIPFRNEEKFLLGRPNFISFKEKKVKSKMEYIDILRSQPYHKIKKDTLNHLLEYNDDEEKSESEEERENLKYPKINYMTYGKPLPISPSRKKRKKGKSKGEKINYNPKNFRNDNDTGWNEEMKIIEALKPKQIIKKVNKETFLTGTGLIELKFGRTNINYNSDSIGTGKTEKNDKLLSKAYSTKNVNANSKIVFTSRKY